MATAEEKKQQQKKHFLSRDLQNYFWNEVNKLFHLKQIFKQNFFFSREQNSGFDDQRTKEVQVKIKQIVWASIYSSWWLFFSTQSLQQQLDSYQSLFSPKNAQFLFALGPQP